MSLKRLNQNAEIWLSTAPLCGIGSGRITSKAEIRSVTTKSSVSPRSNTSRTLPLRSFLIPGRSIEDCGDVCISEQRTFNVCCRASSKNDVRLPHGLQKSAAQIETTLHVVNSIAVRLECRLIAKLGWPDVAIVWMSYVPADPTVADAALQIRNVVGLLQSSQFCQLLSVGRLSEDFALSRPLINPGCK